MANLIQIPMNIVLSILLSILFVHAYFNRNRKIQVNKIFMWIMGLTSFTLILEILSVILNNPDLKQFIILHKMVNLMGFIVAPCIPLIGYIFLKEWVNRYRIEKIKINYILIVPLIINAMGSLMSYNGIGLFHVTGENVYERGPLFFILPCVSYIYFAYSLYFIYKQRKNLTDAELIIFSLFYIVPAVFTVIQLKQAAFLTTWNSTAIIIVVAYIFMINDQANRDSLTGLENRLSYEHYAQNLDHKKLNNLFIVYIDIDDFKSINDRYGHCIGDEAIKEFSKLLVESFPLRHKKLIRLGGDEFLIVMEKQQQDKVLSYIQALIKRVDTYNNLGEKPYKIEFGYDMACYTNNYNNIYELFDYADHLMYGQKHSRKGKL